MSIAKDRLQTLFLDLLDQMQPKPEYLQALRESVLEVWKNRQTVDDGYVTGFEPSINFPNPRSFEKAQGRVAELAPGEQASHAFDLADHYDLPSGPLLVSAEYRNPPGEVCGFNDTGAFFDGARERRLPAPLVRPEAAAGGKAGTCAAGAASLCLLDGRFSVEVEWRTPDGTAGAGKAIPATDESGYFWFFNESNIELVVKVLDGRAFNDRFWVFYGALSDVEYWVTITDTETAARRVYHNPPGEICGRADTAAF